MRALFATDGSEGATLAAEWLRVFPLPAATEILVLTVVPAPDSVTSEMAEALQHGAREVAEAARRTLGQRWPGVQVRVLDGDPRSGILSTAEEWGAELVVLGARGLGAFAGMLLGSVSVGVARSAPCPVLVPKGIPRSVRSVLVAVDDSPDSLAAGRYCRSLELDPGARVRLFGVAELPRFPSAAPEMIRPQLRAAFDDIVRERTRHLEEALAAIERDLASGPDGLTVGHSVATGNPGEAIVEMIGSTQADLAVVGARGLGALGRLLLGSVSEHVLQHAACPVLVVKDGGRSPSRG